MEITQNSHQQRRRDKWWRQEGRVDPGMETGTPPLHSTNIVEPSLCAMARRSLGEEV